MAVVAGSRACVDLTVGQWLDGLMAHWLLQVDAETEWYAPLTLEQEYDRAFILTFLDFP
jgi:hypothetical protein